MKAYKLKHKSWQVPSFNYNEFFKKKNKYCLCIPVINEGERIRREIKQLHDNKITKLVDVIIADGGSKDGSLDFAYLKKNGIRSLLVKTGPGKLSAQMRMAMSYGIEQGYKGLIFVDGNNKDDITAVPLFVKKLDEGFDHIQGSRYIKGGKAINTPAFRHYAVKFIHIPLISLASRRWHTDTTNGFRAYSVNFLLDKKVLPFRDVFSQYELHYYLSIRASRLKFKLTEVPVTREYPKTGKTPSKISPIKGMIKIFSTLIKACTGRFNPK